MKKSSRMSIVHSHAAGVDIGAKFHVVAVPPDADAEPIRTFQSFTGDLHRMSDWLKTCHITTVAMESTGVYWLPAFEILEAAGFNMILVNVSAAKNVPGRKTDVNDALNRPGFPGECFICELRLPDHRFRWKHNKLFLLLPEEYGPAFPAIVDCYTSPPT